MVEMQMGAKVEALLQLQAHQVLEVVEEGAVLKVLDVLELEVLVLSFFNFKVIFSSHIVNMMSL